MPHLIDSDWTIDHLEEVPQAQQFLTRLAADGIAISIVTYAEAYHGTLRSPDPNGAQAKLSEFVSGVPVLPFSLPVAQEFARLRETLRQQGKEWRRRALDLVIAATAIHYNLTLVTRNIDDFDDIPGLNLYQPS